MSNASLKNVVFYSFVPSGMYDERQAKCDIIERCLIKVFLGRNENITSDSYGLRESLKGYALDDGDVRGYSWTISENTGKFDTKIEEAADGNCFAIRVTFDIDGTNDQINHINHGLKLFCEDAAVNGVTLLSKAEFEAQYNAYFNKKKGGCYIATCVYGSYDCPQVWTLRRYRDSSLSLTWYGRTFIRIYYAISPTIVKWFGKTKWFELFWRTKLDKFVLKLNGKGVSNQPYKD